MRFKNQRRRFKNEMSSDFTVTIGSYDQNAANKTPETIRIENRLLHKLLAEYLANEEEETQS